MNRLENKVAIVTGAGNGIGQATAILFAKEGAAVAVLDTKEADGLETVRQIEAAGGKAKFWPLNVSKEADVEVVFADVAKTFGKIDILINNAGITGADKSTHEVTEAEWDAVFAVDVKGVFFCTKHALPYMKKLGKGSIVNVSSIYGLIGSKGDLSPYHAAKGAVTLMTRQDAVTYAPDNIRVNSVHPGMCLTPMVEGRFVGVVAIDGDVGDGVSHFAGILEVSQTLSEDVGVDVDDALARSFGAYDNCGHVLAVHV